MPKTYEPIATQTVGTAIGTVTFASIPQTYTDLVLVVTSADNTDNTRATLLRFNSDTGTNYSFTEFYGNGASALSSRQNNFTSAPLAYFVAPDTTLGNSINVAHIMNYSNTTTYKTVFARENSLSAYGGAGLMVSLWRSTSAITSINVIESGNFKVGSTFTLYGIKAA
jgi:hypothetical protein